MIPWANKPRKGIGEAKRVIQHNEEGFYPALEQLFHLHRLDYWHNTVAMRSQPGWPDYTLFGDQWLAFVEVKARQASGRMGKLSPAQERYRASVLRAGAEYRVILLPDDWKETGEWLTAKTGIEARVW